MTVSDLNSNRLQQVVSFNSTKRRTESFIVSYIVYTLQIYHCVQFKCCSAVFGVTLKLVINISPSLPAINKHRRLLPAKCHNLRYGGPTASY